ncbi:D-2-hydroxyacid dehydrogenase [Gammaproteobacteria bacterium]|nr:D-2-hydroxyacid dehydrogenase [Gammaproteobacteria bacterium]
MRIVISEDNNKLYRSELLAFDPSMEIIALNPLDSRDPAWEVVPESDALFMCYQFLFAARDHPEIHDALLTLSKRMKFIQSGFAGMDSPILQAILKIENIQIANASSVYAIPIAHYVFSQILRWNKRIDQHIEFQQSKNWAPVAGDGELTDKTLVILGYGGIGKQVAKLGKAFGMKVTGIKRNPVDDEYADEVLGLDQFEELLPLTDYLVLALPDSAQTRDIINADVLKKLNNSAMLINVGRGTAINELDLADALNSEEISAAALDTTKNEPLENSSSLWTAKNCFISAHDSAHSLKSLIRAFELFFQNIKNIQNGQSIKNLYSE